MPTHAAAGLPAALPLPAAGSGPAPSGDGALFEALLGAKAEGAPMPVVPATTSPSVPSPEGPAPMRLDAGVPADVVLAEPVAGAAVEPVVLASEGAAVPDLAARADVAPPDLPTEASPERPVSQERPSMEWPRAEVESESPRPAHAPDAPDDFRVPTVETTVDDSAEPSQDSTVRRDIGKPRTQMAPAPAPVQNSTPRPPPVLDAPPSPLEATVAAPQTLDVSVEPEVALAVPLRPRQAPRRQFSTVEPSRIEAAPGSAPLTSEAVDAPEPGQLPEALRTFEHNDVEPLPGSVKLRGVRGARVAVDLGNGEVVRGTIDVQDGEVDVQLKASEEAALRAEKRVGELKEALDEKGMKLARFTVDTEEQERRERRQQREQRQRQYNNDDEAPGGFFNRRA